MEIWLSFGLFWGTIYFSFWLIFIQRDSVRFGGNIRHTTKQVLTSYNASQNWILLPYSGHNDWWDDFVDIKPKTRCSEWLSHLFLKGDKESQRWCGKTTYFWYYDLMLLSADHVRNLLTGLVSPGFSIPALVLYCFSTLVSSSSVSSITDNSAPATFLVSMPLPDNITAIALSGVPPKHVCCANECSLELCRMYASPADLLPLRTQMITFNSHWEIS